MAWYHLLKGPKVTTKIYKLRECEEYILLDSWDRLRMHGLHKGHQYKNFENRYIQKGGRLTSNYYRLIFATLRKNNIEHYLPPFWVDGEPDVYAQYAPKMLAKHRKHILTSLNELTAEKRKELIKQKEFEVVGLARNPTPYFEPDNFDNSDLINFEDVDDDIDEDDSIAEEVRKPEPIDMVKKLSSKIDALKSQTIALHQMVDELNQRIIDTCAASAAKI